MQLRKEFREWDRFVQDWTRTLTSIWQFGPDLFLGYRIVLKGHTLSFATAGSRWNMEDSNKGIIEEEGTFSTFYDFGKHLNSKYLLVISI